jgi:hypothetical protein
MTIEKDFQNLIGKSLVVTPVPTLTYTSKYFNPFNNATWNFGQMAPILFSTIGDFFGSNTTVYGMILVNIIGLIWIRQEDAALPLFMLFILTSIFFLQPGFLPEAWRWFLVALEVLVMGAIGYTLWRGRRIT